LKKLDSFSPKLPSLVQDYLDGKETVSDLFEKFPDYQTLIASHDQIKSRSLDRETLVKVLLSQSKGSDYSTELTTSQINNLKEESVSSITTGHQLCVYGGPMFFLYKILSVISLSEKLKVDGKSCVPIYWMASEDHDFEEINHIFVKGEKVNWSTSQSGPVGRMHLKELDVFKQRVADILKDDYRYDKPLQELDQIFGAEKTLSEAIRDFVYWIFADSGVVVIDADDKDLKSLFAPYLNQELEYAFSQTAIENNNRRLSTLGYSAQVAGREINLFWMKDGYRERIIKTEFGFETADGLNQWAKEELLALVKTNPECFSPNVILRPLYQEVMLPNLAYVGGPGETSYWLQLKGVFDSANVQMPMVLLRDMFTVVDTLAVKNKKQLDVEWVDLFDNQDELVKRLLRKDGSHEDIVAKRQEILQLSFIEMIHELSHFDESLRQNAEAEMVRLNNKLESLKKKVLRSEKMKNEVLVGRVDHLYEFAFPNGSPQERILNGLGLWPNPDSILELLPHCNPFEAKIKVVEQT
jgi:bacillithiol biosynthesis cysteine-adding enzyme BshC